MGTAVRGASHERKDRPNEDAIAWGARGDNLVLAVSDGHGSESHFYSHIGAQFAVEVAVETILEEVGENKLSAKKVLGISKDVRDKLPHRIANRWRDKVGAHYQKQPETNKGSERREGTSLYRPYGATLLVVLVAKHFILYLQLGDGDILVVKDKGKEIDRLFVDEEERIGPATDSLCLSNPESYFKFSLRTFKQERPELILVTTDGYINSFRRDEDFLNLGKEFLDLLVAEGTSYVENNLENWLKATSQEGSGDDITAGLIYDLEVVK